jgi:hypothetical protein
MYNTDFVVRYHDIETELINKLKRKTELKKEKELKEIEQREKELEQRIKEEAAVKKKGRKKASSVVETITATASEPVKVEEPKKRGRKKVIKEEPKKEEETKNDDVDEDYEYTMDDVYIICEKLYRDELLSVFKVNPSSDGNIDNGIKNMLERMIDTTIFKQILDDIKLVVIDFNQFTGTPTEIENIRRNSEYIIFITFFSQRVFYIAHKCFCQFLTAGEIDERLIDQLKEKTISIFKQ